MRGQNCPPSRRERKGYQYSRLGRICQAPLREASRFRDIPLTNTKTPPEKVLLPGEKNYSIVDLVRKKASKTVAASHICIGRIIFVDLKVD